MSDCPKLTTREPSEVLIWTVMSTAGEPELQPVKAGEFEQRVRVAARWLEARGIGFGDFFLLAFGENHLDELVLRAAAGASGAIPVTVNWQADDVSAIELKAKIAGALQLVVHETMTRLDLDGLEERCGALQIYRLEAGAFEREELLPGEVEHIKPEDRSLDQVMIFTSGTTGRPKGVRLSRKSYDVNAEVFEDLLELNPDRPLRLLLVNPLYHANSTAMADFGLRRSSTEVVLVPRYSGDYWTVLEKVCEGFDGDVIAPAVSRHFEFLDNLLASGKRELGQGLTAALKRTRFLVGSAPVGPETLARFERLTGRPPQVRFGSTELCLQALAIPSSLSSEDVLKTFARGVQAAESSEGHVGYYIGRPHPPRTDAKVVREIQSGAEGFLEPSGEGELGYLVVRSGSVMTGYSGNPEATRAALQDGWYLGLGDMAFWLGSADGAERDYFWVSRTAGLMIRGGSNYSCQQVESELTLFVAKHFRLSGQDFELAVVGEKLDSEHEDACCVLIALLTDSAQALRARLEAEFISAARQAVSKGARPDHLAFGDIPRNFKGAIIRADVRKSFTD